jgi:hypothetical protein
MQFHLFRIEKLINRHGYNPFVLISLLTLVFSQNSYSFLFTLVIEKKQEKFESIEIPYFGV